MKFKTYSLGELVQIKYGKSQKKVYSENGKYPIYGTGGLMGYAKEALYDKPSVLIGRKGSISKVRYVDHPFWTVDTLFYTIVNTKLVLPKYLFYLMSQIDLNIYNEGTTIPSLRTETLNRLEFKIPSINEQMKILSYIEPIDNIIEVNMNINKNLIQQSQALYSAWFEQFLPFGGSMPSDWHIGTLGDIATIKTNSFNPQKNPGVMLEHYSIPAYDEQHFPVFEPSDNVKSNKYILTDNSVLASKLNPDTKRIWRPMCLTDHAVCSTEFIVFDANNSAHKDFLFSIIDSQSFSDWMCAHTTGSTNSRQRTTPSTTLEFKVPIASNEVIDEFCASVTPMYALVSQNLQENQRLASLRDSLLPKLMTGEIDVSDVDL
ncbi:restriction endonuclease subunit S [Sharpea azabuensis]|uniref:restriction endonuclease subunit S n=1 Tax=Sharpea azabuensis TaxID=322505 RepID=UPI003CFCD97F